LQCGTTPAPGEFAREESSCNAQDDHIESSNYRVEEDDDSVATTKELSEETHLFAKFTCTYKIWDFINRENQGLEPEFPQNELVPVQSRLSRQNLCLPPNVYAVPFNDCAGC